MRGTRAVTRAIALVVAVVGVACGSTDAVEDVEPVEEVEPVVEPVDLAVDVERSRSAQAQGVLHVRLSNGGDTPLEVTSLQLVDPRFTEVQPNPKTTTVEPGGRPVLTPIDYGEVVCDDGTGGPAALAVTVQVAGGTQETVLPVGSAGEDMLARLHETTCKQHLVADAATVAFGPEWESIAPAVARGRITIERGTSDERVSVEQAEGTVIFSLTVLGGTGSEVVALEEGQATAEVAIEVSAARCDPHALIESKKTYSFPIWVRIGDDPDTTYLVLEPEGPARRALEELLTVGCDQAG